MAEHNGSHDRAAVREITLPPVFVDSGLSFARKPPVIGFLTLGYIVTSKLELLDMFCDLL